MYGFDDYVDLIAYPYGEFGDSKTKIYRILFGEIFYVPAEWQVLMRFGPQAHNEGSSFQDVTYESAKLKTRFNWVADIIEGEEDLDTVTILERDGTDNYADGSHEYADGDKVDWEGNTITWSEWFDEELINVGGVSVTKEDAAIGTTVIIVCCIIGGLICMYISWRKRKEIAAGARASIQIIRRQSQRLS